MLRLKREVMVGVLVLVLAESVGIGSPDAGAQAMSGAREVISLNSAWRVHQGDVTGAEQLGFDDASWGQVTLPHSWHNPNPEAGGGVYSKGISWYRRTLALSAKGKSLFLEFDGVGEICDVYLDGEPLGEHRGPYGRFRFDISGRLKPGTDHVLAVRVDNRSPADVVGHDRGWVPFGGIYRDVSLIVTDPIHVDMMESASSGVYVTPSAVSSNSAIVQVVVKLANNLSEEKTVRVKTILLDGEGKPVREMQADAILPPGGRESVRVESRLEKPHLWHGVQDPYLYSARVEVCDESGARLDVVAVPFGIRSYRFDPNEGFFLNGQSCPIKGVSLHQERKGAGWAVTREMFEEDLDILLEMGGNAVRSHYQMSDTFYELCAQKGVLVWGEIPFWQYRKVSKPLLDNAKLQLGEMVLQNYNNPSMLIWSVGNECYVKFPQIRSAIAEMHDYVHSLDNTRVTTYANPRGFGDLPQPVSELTDIATYNWYCGWYVDTKGLKGPAGRVGELADSYHAYYPNQSIGISEYGASACIDQHQQNAPLPNPTGKWFPEEYQSQLHEIYWKQVAERPYLYGVFIWCMYDFNIAGWTRGSARDMNWKGMVTQDRKIRKDAFYYYKANWSDDPFVHITSRRHVKRAEAVTDVKIYSNCSAVQLTVNGHSQGDTTAEHGVFKWQDITLQPGENAVEVIAEQGGRKYRDSCIWIYGEDE